MSGPFVDKATYAFDRIKPMPILMTEGRGAIWRRQGDREEVTALEPGLCLTISGAIDAVNRPVDISIHQP